MQAMVWGSGSQPLLARGTPNGNIFVAANVAAHLKPQMNYCSTPTLYIIWGKTHYS
jgi:hypothetical protein